MTAITYTAARENLASTMNRVCDNHEPVIITRNRDQAVVLMSLADYNALEETAYLTRSPANARRLLESMKEIEEGKVVKKKLGDLTKYER
jgi:antitoxin YefM